MLQSIILFSTNITKYLINNSICMLLERHRTYFVDSAILGFICYHVTGGTLMCLVGLHISLILMHFCRSNSLSLSSLVIMILIMHIIDSQVHNLSDMHGTCITELDVLCYVDMVQYMGTTFSQKRSILSPEYNNASLRKRQNLNIFYLLLIYFWVFLLCHNFISRDPARSQEDWFLPFW